MKKLIGLIIFCISMTSLTALAAELPSPKSSLQQLDKVVAVVNSEIITQSQLNTAIARAKLTAAKMHMSLPSPSTLRNAVLNQVIDRKLQIQIAKRNHVKITEEQINHAIGAIAKHNKLTLTQLKSKLRQEGHTFAQFKKQLHNQLLIQQVMRQGVTKDIRVSSADIKKFMQAYKKHGQSAQQYHLVDILVPVNNTSDKAELNAAILKAQIIRKRLIHRETTLAKVVAAGGVNVSDLDWRPATAIPNVFLKVVPKTVVGGYSKIITAANGVHFIKLIEKRAGAVTMPTRQQAQRYIYQQKFVKAAKKLIKKLRKNASIKINN